MNKEQQRVAIAEWMGDFKGSHLAIWKTLQDGWKRCEVCGRVQGTAGEWLICAYPNLQIPNYPADLNAMHEAVLKLSPAELIRYTEILCDEVELVDWGYYPGEASIDWDEVSKIATADAAKCSKSLCRTLWPERFE